MTRGRLYAVGIGPGDPELITLKAVRILREAEVIAVPKGKEDGESVALGIVESIVDMQGKRLLEIHFPMRKGPQREALGKAAKEVLGLLYQGRDVAFITLGDPTLYSTFFHLLDAIHQIEPGLKAEIIPGVSSITASAAAASMSLALSGDRVAVIPATYVGDLDSVLDGFQTVILMKAHSVIEEIKAVLARRGLLGGAVFVSRAGRQGEVIKPLSEVNEGDLNYFSTVIVRTRNA